MQLLAPTWRSTWLRPLALFILLVWSAFWFFFGLAAGIGGDLGVGRIFLHILFPGVVFILCTLYAMWKPRPGGILLVVIGALVGIGYPALYGHLPRSLIVFVLLAMAIPPFVAGILFLFSAKASAGPDGDNGGTLPA